MAFVATQILIPTRRSGIQDFLIDRRRPVTIFAFTKAGGDVSATLDSKLQTLREVIILDADGVSLISGAAGTVGFGEPGTFTTSLTGLGGGTSGFILCQGNNVRH